jgi:hypothetical protein
MARRLAFPMEQGGHMKKFKLGSSSFESKTFGMTV